MWRFLACFVIGIGSVQSLVTPASRSVAALRPHLVPSKWFLFAAKDTHEGPPFPLYKRKHACNLFGDPYFYNGDAKLAKQDAAARKDFLGETSAVEVLKYGEIMNGFQSAAINSARVRSYVNTFRSKYRWARSQFSRSTPPFKYPTQLTTLSLRSNGFGNASTITTPKKLMAR
jgi:hypothetical protein